MRHPPPRQQAGADAAEAMATTLAIDQSLDGAGAMRYPIIEKWGRGLGSRWAS